jgi:hypothetical protein
MKVRQFAAVLAVLLALAACGSDTYESVSKDLDELMAGQVSLTTEDKAQVMALREKGAQLHSDGKAEESVKALTQARDIIQRAKDAALIGKSDG